jgi:hypothetical protein
MIADRRISNKYGSEYGLATMTQQNSYVSEGGASNQVSAPLVRNSLNQTSISYVNYSIELNFNQTSKRQFETSEAMRILNIRHVISK